MTMRFKVVRRVDEDHETFPPNAPACPWTSADECAMARERAVAGVSDTIPACPTHGQYPNE